MSPWRLKFKAKKAQIKRRRVARGRVGNKIKQPVQYFKRTVFAPAALSATGAVTTYDAGVFRLTSLPDVGDFTSLYDQYRILSVKYVLMPRGNVSDLGTAGAQISRLFTVIDYDDSSPPSSIDQLCQYQNLKVTNATAKHVRIIKPMYNREVSTGLGTTANEPSRGWLDCTNNNVAHRGVKLALQGPVTGTITYDAMITYNLAFKNVR